jgi:anti-sigma factor RsiW
MECHNFKKWVINKDILDESVEKAAREHLEMCERCRKLYTMDARIEAQIKEELREVEAPGGLLSRIEMDIQSTDKVKMFTHLSWKKLIPAVAVAALLLIFLNPFAGGFKSIEEIGSLAVDNHLDKDMTMAFRAGEVRDVSRWFEDRLGFRVSNPNLEQQGFRFLGGRKCSLGGNDAAYLFYEKAGEKVSLFIIDPSDLNFSMGVKMSNISFRGCDIKIWKEGDQVYAMVT